MMSNLSRDLEGNKLIGGKLNPLIFDGWKNWHAGRVIVSVVVGVWVCVIVYICGFGRYNWFGYWIRRSA
jgi:hypothetical protein